METYLIVWSGVYENTQLAVQPTFIEARKVHDKWMEDADEDDTIDVYKVTLTGVFALDQEGNVV